jgi:hypothetical protein
VHISKNSAAYLCAYFAISYCIIKLIVSISPSHSLLLGQSRFLFLPGVEASFAIRQYELSDIFVAAISLALKFANGIIAVSLAASSFIKFNLLEIISRPCLCTRITLPLIPSFLKEDVAIVSSLRRFLS